MTHIAILGYGVVGSGVFQAFSMNSEMIDKKAGRKVRIKRILDLRDFPGDPAETFITHDFNDILNDGDITVAAESMGGIGAAYEFTKALLSKGVSVVSSNKELVCERGAELTALAREHNANYLFEASVGGGIPVIRPINDALTADYIVKISGILNGTTNYILTKMAGESADYERALIEAQKLVYAESNPENDTEGYDARRKIAILLSLASGGQVDHKEIHAEGITRVTQADINIAKQRDFSLKLVASGEIRGDKITACVSPMLIRRGDRLHNVDGAYNAVKLTGNLVGDVAFYGAGAGKLPTSSAICADIIAAVKHKDVNIPVFWRTDKMKVAPFLENECKKLVIIGYKDEINASFAVKSIFGVAEIVVSNYYKCGEMSFITNTMTEREMEAKIHELAKADGVGAVLNSYRIFE